MITLHKATYCENCPEFEAVTEKLYSNDEVVFTKVYCKHYERCCHIFRHIKAQAEREKEKETAEREKWACQICPDCKAYVALKESPNKEYTCTACGHKWRAQE